MRILCISYEYPPLGGGGAPVCERLCRAFATAGHQVDVLTSGLGELAKAEARDGVRIYRTPCIRRHQHYTTALELVTTLGPAYRKGCELIDANKYDLIHCHFIVPSGLVAYALSRRGGIPYVLTAHGSDIPGYNPDRFKLLHRVIRPIWARVVTGARAVTTPSRFLRELMLRQIDIPIDLIPNTFELPPSSRLARKNRVLAVSRLFERKGIQYLLDAFSRLDSEWELVIAGDGPYLDTLRKQNDRIAAGAHFPGFVKGSDLRDMYATAKIFVLPSVRENFPVVLLEAMAAGCAVITTRGSGCEEVIGDAGLLVEPADVATLAEAIERLMKNDSLRLSLSRQAVTRAASFGDAAIAKRFETLFDNCCDSPGGASTAEGL